MKRQKAYIYTRVSTALQVEGYSLDAQLDRINKYATAFDIEIVRTYTDAGKSGKSILGRSEFIQMLDDVEADKDKVNYVLVFKLSRFGRNAADTLNALQIMENHGVNLICVDDGLDSSKDSGKLVITILSAVSEMERENIRAQTMEGRKQKAREGKWNGGSAPLGYSLKDGKLVINEEEAESVRIIFDLYANTDLGANGVAKHLSNLDIKKPVRQNGKSPYFSAHLIRQILDNPVYNGNIAYGWRKTKLDKKTGKSIQEKSNDYIISDGIHEAIIDEELWIKTKNKRKSQSKKYEKISKGKNENTYILSGVVKCPVCGASLYGNKSIKKNKNKKGELYKEYRYYACKHRKLMDGYKCNFNKQIKMEILDREVEQILVQLMRDSNLANKLKEKISIKTDTQELDEMIGQYEQKYRVLNGTKASIINQIDTLDYEDKHYQRKFEDLNIRLNNTYDQIEEIEGLIREYQDRKDTVLEKKLTTDNIYTILINFNRLYSVLKDVDKKRLCQLLIEEIQIHKEKTEKGNWIKSLVFKLPVIEEKLNISLDNGEHVEALVLMTRE